MTNRLELDLPFEQTQISRLLLWMLAVGAFLAVCAFAVALTAEGALRAARERPIVITIALPPAEEPEQTDERAVLDWLATVDGVAFVEPVPAEEVARMIEPTGSADAAETGLLPVPRLIDVGFRPDALPDRELLEGHLRALAPGASLGNAADGAASESARTVRTIAVAAGLCTLLAISAISAFITRTSVRLHADAVDLLRQMGAADAYIARQFELHALGRALVGAAVGFGGATLVLLLSLELLRRFGPSVLQQTGLRPLDWLLLALVPALIVLATTLAARLTAARELARPQ